MNKAEALARLVNNFDLRGEVDYTLPQDWLNNLAEKMPGEFDGNYFDVLSSFVWYYPPSSRFGRPLPITSKGFKIWEDHLATP